MEDLQGDRDASQSDDDPFASVPGTLSKLLTGFVRICVRTHSSHIRYTFPISVYLDRVMLVHIVILRLVLQNLNHLVSIIEISKRGC